MTPLALAAIIAAFITAAVRGLVHICNEIHLYELPHRAEQAEAERDALKAQVADLTSRLAGGGVG